MTVLRKAKDPGTLSFSGSTFPAARFEECVLSMTGASTRSRFESCKFGTVTAIDCTVGHPIFTNCAFGGVIADDDALTTYEALFLECRFSGVLRNVNFGNLRNPSPFFSEERFKNDLDALQAARYGIDISGVEVIDNCSFLGDLFVKQLRFRPGQGVLIRGAGLDKTLDSIFRSTTDPDLQLFLTGPIGFGSSQETFFLPAPTKAPEKLAAFTKLVCDTGVDVSLDPSFL